MRYFFIPDRLAHSTKSINNQSWHGCVEKGASSIATGKLVGPHVCETIKTFLHKLNTELLYDSAILSLGVNPKDPETIWKRHLHFDF